MGSRLTNLALLVLTGLALLSGTTLFAVGVPAAGWVAVAHGIIGVAVLVLSPWKQAVARRGLRKERSGRSAALVLAALTVVTLLAGFAHTTGLVGLPGGITTMQVHVGTALALIPLVAWHVVARPVRPRRVDASRRNALRSTGVLGAAALGYGATEAVHRLAVTAGATRRFTGSHETGSHDPQAMPVTQWLFDRVPQVDPGRWQLTVAGRMLSYDELLEFDDRFTAVTDCTGGWWAEQDWAGARLDRLVGDPGSARSVVVGSVTGYTRRFPPADLHCLLLATRLEGASLSPGHGFPARLVAPGRRGFWWVKWVERVDLDDRPWWAQAPFPLQ